MSEKIYYLALIILLFTTFSFAQEEVKNSIPLDAQQILEQHGFEIIQNEKDSLMDLLNFTGKDSSFLIKVKKTLQETNNLYKINPDSNEIIFESFEGEFPGNQWQLFGNPTWGKTNFKSHSGSFSGWCAQGGSNGTNPPNPYPNNCSSKIVYGPFDLSSSNSSKLCFSFWSDTEPGADWFFWMASIDGINFYGNGFSGETFIGTGGSYWMDIEFSLKNIPTLGDITSNSQVWIAFLFESDNNSTSDNGVFIDDILLHKDMPEWPTSPGAPLAICTSEGDQTHPSILMDNYKNILLSWGGTNISAQKLNPDGFIQWPNNGIQLWNSGYRTHNYLLIKSNSDCYILGWREVRTYGGRNNYFYVQKIDQNGNPLWGVNGIELGSSDASTGLGSIRNHWNTDGVGGILFIEQYCSGYSELASIRAKRVDSSGNEKWNIFLSENDKYSNLAGKIIPDGNGGAFVAWCKYVPGLFEYHGTFYAQKISLNGALLWGTEGVNVTAYMDKKRFHDLTTDGNGGAIILFSGVVSGKRRIYIQKIDSEGNLVWQHYGIQINKDIESASLGETKIISDGMGGAIVVWTRQPIGEMTMDINALKIDSLGNIAWNTYPNRAIRHSFGGISGLMVKSDGKDGAIIGWSDYRAYDYLTDLYAQRIDSQGNILWQEDGIPVCIPYPWGLTIENFDMISDNEGGAIFGIELKSTYTFYEVPSDIYVQRILPNGDLGISTYVSDLNNTFAPSEYMLMQNYPNPFNSSTTIKYSLPKTVHVTIQIYNVLGQVVTTLIDEKQGQGCHLVLWDGKDMLGRDVASGIYIYSVKTRDFLKAHKMTLIR